MSGIEDDWLPLRLVDSPAVSLPSDVCVFSTIPEVEAYRFASWWMKRADETSERLARSAKLTPQRLDHLRLEREETHRIYLDDVWDQTYARHHRAWSDAREAHPVAARAIDGFFYRFEH